jgi:DNA polymerase theta
MQDYPNIYGGTSHVNKEVDGKSDKICFAIVLGEFINEIPISEITKRFKIAGETVQSLQMQSSSFTSQIARFCELFGAGLLAATLLQFARRLNFGARTELLGLVVLPSITKWSAREFFECGMASPMDLAGLTLDAIALVLAPRGHRGEAAKKQWF